MVGTSCNDLLDKEPISQITPDQYFHTADQLGSYIINYYNNILRNPNVGTLYHDGGYNDGLARSDNNTDLFVAGSGNTTLFSAEKNWNVPAGKNLQGDFFNLIRVTNYFFEQTLPKFQQGEIAGNKDLVRNFMGEAYFMRALVYYKALVEIGDFPIITSVVPNNQAQIAEASKRLPRNEVARFILADLDSAATLLFPRNRFRGQRLNKEAALLFKSRVALFEGTFEKYHRGTGRVPGDATWPGATQSYNQGKTFDIDGEIKFFLSEAMKAAKEIADNATLTTNSHAINPSIGTVYGWNPYFEMFSSPSLASVPEVLLWKEYNITQNIRHTVPARVKGGSNSGYTRTFVESFLMKDGKPIYATGSDYRGDTHIDSAKTNRDERLQLFVWGESDYLETDPESPNLGKLFGVPGLTVAEVEKRSLSGYQPRKYFTYEFAQNSGDAMLGYNACPVFRASEALLNYMEACYELNGTLDADAINYWKQLRQRAGITAEYTVTDAHTDLSKEPALSVYSGENQVSVTLYNIRRERMSELFSEGLRYNDLIRWRSFDQLLSAKWIPEGVNFWAQMYTHYNNVTAAGTSKSNMSQSSLSTYVRPYSYNMSETNQLRDGYSWFKAYYLRPLGIAEIQLASPDGSLENSFSYQNPYWPIEANGKAIE